MVFLNRWRNPLGLPRWLNVLPLTVTLFVSSAAFTVQNSSSAIAAGRVLFAFESVLRCGGVTFLTYLSFFSCIAQTSHVSFRLDVCARCATMSATTWLVAENDRASTLCLLASFSSVHSGRYWTICCKMGYTLLRVVLVFVFIALVLYTRKADQDNAFCFLSGGFAE